MEPDIMRLYSSSPPPMEDAEEEDQDDFGDFGAFSAVSASGSFSEPDAPGHASFATSPPELLNGLPAAEEAHREAKANGAAPASHPPLVRRRDRSDVKRPGPRAAGDGDGIIANGFAASDVRPGPCSFVSDRAAGDVDGPEAEFADFAAFSDTGRHGDTARRGCAAWRTASDREATPLPTTCDPEAERHAADFVPDRASGVHTSGRRNSAGERAEGCADVNGIRADAVCPRGIDELCVHVDDGVSVDGDRVDGSGAAAGGGYRRASETDTETETWLGRPLSTEALEDHGNVSTTGSAPSPPPLQEENATPADHSQLDDDDEEFGDFGDAAAAGPEGKRAFADFTPQEACPPPARDRFGDLDGPRPDADGEGGASFADARWSAFGEESEGESWAAFRSEAAAPPAEAHRRAQTPTVDRDGSGHAEALWSRVEKLLEMSFPRADGPPPAAEGQVASLKTLVEARQDDAGSVLGGGVWRRLRDIHEAVGLGHQWGGSYCNKTLLGCLGIDTRNILFTGQKKQPLIVPVYAASLGMLEPTKEPAKPVSAAEMIASIAQAPTAAPDGASCPSDVVVQEPLPPVRFDWSSSGLTNPLDASGGSFLLNLDFFGPVDDSGSSCSPTIPGVDPELVELTTAKMEPGAGAGARVVDAFARLMSTMDKTSTSTRRMRKEERLSSEAAEVICGLPDLSFMTAKVLMFPATLMPLASQATPD